VVLPNVHGSRLLREFTGQLLPVRSAGVERSGGIRQALDVPSCSLTKALRATYGMLFQVGQYVNDILVIISVRAISTGSTRSTNTISQYLCSFSSHEHANLIQIKFSDGEPVLRRTVGVGW
jgi:ABC-type phosphate/phosphonate transport system ATPase subunit